MRCGKHAQTRLGSLKPSLPDIASKGLIAALAACMAFVMVAIYAEPAAAEQKGRPKTLLELFMRSKKKAEKPATKKTRARRSGSQSGSSSKPRQQIPDKLENAKTVLVFGDFNAGSLASGLEKAFETTPGVVIESRIKGSSGLVRQDYYDWPGVVPELFDEVKPAVAVISIGGNDRQNIETGDAEYQFRSPEWKLRYEQRIQTIITAASQRNVPLLWAGLPSFRSTSFAADMVTLNSMYRQAAEKAENATYIDLWEGFVDENGKFTYSGSDIDGQQVRLRTSDGLGFTTAGKRKQAFYVERHIKRIIGSAANANFVNIPANSLTDLSYFPPVNSKQLVRTEPISITDPALDGGDGLLGGPNPPLPAASPLNRLLQNGYTGPETAGRADYYNPASQTQ